MNDELTRSVRMTVIAVLAFLCLMCLAADPATEEHWMGLFLTSKAVALAFGLAAYLLYRHWERRGRLPEMDDE